MIRRFALPLLLCATLLAGAAPSTALARTPVRGMKINKVMTVSTTTGNCSCNWEWFTVGLRPGQFVVSARITSCTVSMGNVCGMYIDMLEGGAKLTGVSAACYSATSPCRRSLALTYRVSHAGVYYLYVRGAGAQIIRYQMHVRGNIYPLQCRNAC